MEAAFDTMAYAERLEKGGINREHARLHAEALRVAFNEGVATKADLRELKACVKRRFDAIMWAGGGAAGAIGLLAKIAFG